MKNTFLSGKLVSPVFLKVPSGVNVPVGYKKLVLKLKKALYGLKEALKTWNYTLNEFLMEVGLKRSSFDDCLFHNDYELFLLIYVHDILVIGR